MMKKFLLVVCGSFVGVILALTFFVISAIITSIAMMSMGGNMNGKASVVKNTLLRINLEGEILERDNGTNFDFMTMLQGGGMPKTMGLNTVINAIEKAKENDDIKGIVLECNGSSAAPATRAALRAALVDFKASKKFIYAYGYSGFSQGDYYLASVADSIFINPEGSLDIHGMASATPYMKNLLAKVGVEMQVIRVGTFKSAVEPYMLDSISPANRLQQEHYMGSIWKSLGDSIAASRKIPVDQFNQLVNGVLATAPTDTLVTLHLVDKLCYRNEFEDKLHALTDVDKDEKLHYVTPSDIADDLEARVSGDKIAVVYAVGGIDDGGSGLGSDEGINSEKLSKTILELKDNDDIKGMVLRVNSPGGSAFGSEQIWHAIDEFKRAGKPVAVSMGDYAASGGYYISCNADRIFAEPTTITGSIGIFGVIPSLNDLIENKLGVNVSVVKTHANADMGVMGKKLTPQQLDALQNMVNRGYELFTKRCADGRRAVVGEKMTQDSIKSIAEGRVWDGLTAKSIGLVDEFGNIADAVKWVAKKANLKEDKYKTENYPDLNAKFTEMFDEMMAMRYEERLRGEMGILYEYHKQLQAILRRDHILCLMPESAILD